MRLEQMRAPTEAMMPRRSAGWPDKQNHFVGLAMWLGRDLQVSSSRVACERCPVDAPGDHSTSDCQDEESEKASTAIEEVGAAGVQAAVQLAPRQGGGSGGCQTSEAPRGWKPGRRLHGDQRTILVKKPALLGMAQPFSLPAPVGKVKVA